MTNEQLEIVDKQDNVIGIASRNDIHTKGLLHREVHVWIYNNKGEILFQIRSGAKTFPNLLNASVGGHVNIGESYIAAALRELHEETGIITTPQQLTPLKTVCRATYDTATGTTNNAMRKGYAYRFDPQTTKLNIGKNEASSIEWWPIQKLLSTTPKEAERFAPSLLSLEYLGVFEEIGALLTRKK
ncbi:MAG: NUDIX domain-containing protein [Patescibacteria group bacterium]|jgi:isopentenyldiphosphate isomerase